MRRLQTTRQRARRVAQKALHSIEGGAKALVQPGSGVAARVCLAVQRIQLLHSLIPQREHRRRARCRVLQHQPLRHRHAPIVEAPDPEKHEIRRRRAHDDVAQRHEHDRPSSGLARAPDAPNQRADDQHGRTDRQHVEQRERNQIRNGRHQCWTRGYMPVEYQRSTSDGLSGASAQTRATTTVPALIHLLIDIDCMSAFSVSTSSAADAARGADRRTLVYSTALDAGAPRLDTSSPTMRAHRPSAASLSLRGRISGRRDVSVHAGSIADATISLTRARLAGAAHGDERSSRRLHLRPSRRRKISRHGVEIRLHEPTAAASSRTTVRHRSRRDAPDPAQLDTRRADAASRGQHRRADRRARWHSRSRRAGVRRRASRTGHVLLAETRTTTEWDGRYRITGLPPGEYLVVVLPGASADPARVRANAERRAPESSSATRPFFDATLYPGVTSSESARTVTVFEGITADGIDVWLTRAQRFSISGRVLRPDGVNVENIAIEYANLSAQRSGLWTVPDPGDLFTITGVPTGHRRPARTRGFDRGPLAGWCPPTSARTMSRTWRSGSARQARSRDASSTRRMCRRSARATRIATEQRLLPVSPLYPAPESVVAQTVASESTHGLGEYAIRACRLARGPARHPRQPCRTRDPERADSRRAGRDHYRLRGLVGRRKLQSVKCKVSEQSATSHARPQLTADQPASSRRSCALQSCPRGRDTT